MSKIFGFAWLGVTVLVIVHFVRIGLGSVVCDSYMVPFVAFEIWMLAGYKTLFTKRTTTAAILWASAAGVVTIAAIVMQYAACPYMPGR